MKILNREQFLGMPANTVFAKYEHCCFEDIQIKGDTLYNNGEARDFFLQQIADSVDANNSGDYADLLFDSANSGTSVAMDFHVQMRDGLFDDNQLFAVYEQEDIRALIARLGECLKQGRSDEDDLLQEAGRIIKSWIEEEGYPAHIPDDEVDALLEKINVR